MHFGLFYRPPSSPSCIFDLLYSSKQTANMHTFSNLVLLVLGDFNVNVNTSNPSHPLFNELCNIMNNFSLVQVVSEPTHLSPNGNSSLVDLALISDPSKLSSCAVIPPLGTSDHNGLHLKLKWKKTNPIRNKQRKVWRYKHADFEAANTMLESVDWSELLAGDINQTWTAWRQKFMDVMEKCIQLATLPDKRNLPWLNIELTKSMKARNLAYKKAKRSRSPHDWNVYKKKRNILANKLKQAKQKFFSNLDPSNPKTFWKTAKVVTKKDTRIPQLQSDGTGLITDNCDKANTLNDYFSTCFNNSVPPLSDADTVHGICF